MSNLFKKGFASLALASAMASSVFAGNAAYVNVKMEYANTFKTDSKDGNVTAFKMHIKEGNLVATFNKDANHANLTNVKLTVKKTVAGDGIKGANVVFKQATASGENLMPSNLDKKIAKLTFTFSQRGRENLLIISALTKEDLVNAMPLNATVNRIDKKMHLAVTIDKIGLKKKSTTHFFTKNVVWKKENQLLGNYSFEKQDPQVNLYSDATESTTDENMTNANLLMDGYGQGSKAEKANTFTTNKHIVLSAKTMQNMTKSNTFNDNQVLHMSSRKFVLGSEYEAQRLKLAVVRDKRNLSLNPVEFKAEAEQTNSLSVGMGHFGKNTGKQYISLNFGRLLNDGIVGNLETHATNVVTKGLADQNGKWKKETYLLGTLVEHSKVFTDSIIVKHGIQGHLSFNSDRFLNVNNLGNNIETHTANLVAKGLSNKSGTFNTEKAYMIGQNGANISTVKKHFNSMAA